jgi:hypothetical protein
MKTLPSNEFWGRRSGSVTKNQGNIFKAQQFGSGKSGAGKAWSTKLINVPAKWFGVNYKSKRGVIEPVKGSKKV